jgi:hypothetical protein
MADILIKNVPKEVHEKLKEMALYHHRSMTKEALAVLEEAAGHYSTLVPQLPQPKSTAGQANGKKNKKVTQGEALVARLSGRGTVKMTTDELMKLTRGE